MAFLIAWSSVSLSEPPRAWLAGSRPRIAIARIAVNEFNVTLLNTDYREFCDEFGLFLKARRDVPLTVCNLCGFCRRVELRR